jgi:hypothetical protein
MLGISYWIVPIISATVWGAMLIAMLVFWSAKGHPHYVSMDQGQNIAYISGNKPIFTLPATQTNQCRYRRPDPPAHVHCHVRSDRRHI